VDEKRIEELKAKHGKTLTLVVAPNGIDCVFRKPTRAEFSHFREVVRENHVKAATALLMDTLVQPAWQDLVAIFEEWPGLEDEYASHVVELAKGAEKSTAKKL
jgi:hypothetical protein